VPSANAGEIPGTDIEHKVIVHTFYVLTNRVLEHVRAHFDDSESISPALLNRYISFQDRGASKTLLLSATAAIAFGRPVVLLWLARMVRAWASSGAVDFEPPEWGLSQLNLSGTQPL
jgi:hypothetical protein